ncbi:glycosyltransferase family 2 protein [Coriobacteriia bacterium Es71-Z0120]|uniref:glycosyltransferase family 2 protein n=1 Tax=Parvivirga hydrogeniphila TaxID=2939460 RepID=UPI002260A138|nr:glycosyltransferase family 2 protein [Parvivirga hydrogeniphila]MCL4079353.1 glycosyltransferase family 2 protein [Parvivirga hydrogeniphila]
MAREELHSIVVPMYNEREVALTFLERATAALSALPAYEIIVVDDGSTDGTWEILDSARAAYPNLRLIRFSRNFGHQTAITAGIDAARGDTVTVIDADLQDPPELIPKMVEKWREGADIVFAVRRARRGESLFKKATAAAFYRLMRSLAAVDIPLDSGDFRLMSRRTADALISMRERSRFIRGLVAWLGFQRAYVHYDREERAAGRTKYPLGKMLRLAADGIVSFSLRPLQLAALFGALSALIGFGVIVYAIVERLRGGDVVPGWTSLMVAVLFMGGVQLLSLAILGEYVGRIYDEVRGRPLYVVHERVGFDDEDGARD